MLGHQQRSSTKVRVVAILLLLLEVGIMVAYGVGTEQNTSNTFFPSTSDNSAFFINFILSAILAILGWGLIIAYSQNSAISALLTTLIATGLTIQLQPLLTIFWNYVFSDFQGVYAVSIYESILSVICLVSLMICLCGLSGRLGVAQTFSVVIVFNITWPLNYFLLFYIKRTYWTGEIGEVFDSIGGAYVYLFAGVFSLIVSLFLNCKEGIRAGPSGSRPSAFIALMGTGFAFAAAPFTDFQGISVLGVNTGRTTASLYESALNVYFTLTASVISTYIFSAIFGSLRVGVRQSIVGVLGGVAMVAACAGFISNIGACIAIGAFAGFISGFWLRFAHPRVNRSQTIDHLGIAGPVTINAFLGIFVIAPIIFGAYKSKGLQVAQLSFIVQNQRASTYYLAIGGITLAIAIGGGLLAGLLAFITRDPGDDFHFGKLISPDFGLYNEEAARAMVEHHAHVTPDGHNSGSELKNNDY